MWGRGSETQYTIRTYLQLERGLDEVMVIAICFLLARWDNRYLLEGMPEIVHFIA